MRILYLEGDPCSPKYVEGALRLAGHDVERRAHARDRVDAPDYDVVLLSDVPAADLSEETERALLDGVRGGLGLVAVGGWNSFGRGGYADRPLAAALPVEMEDADDRVTRETGALLRPRGAHPLLDGLPFDRSPVVCGWNRVAPRAGAQVLLEAVDLEVEAGAVRLADEGAPVLVLGEEGAGAVAALALDLAPHWSGGLTDWGGPPLLDVGGGEEVGRAYLAFVDRLVGWAARGGRGALSGAARSGTRR